MKKYQIKNVLTDELWNDIWGWVYREDSECEGQFIITEEEKADATLPIDGEWEEV